MALDRVARRYGLRPSALAAGAVEALALDLLCADVAARVSVREAVDAGALVQAVVVV